VPRKSLSYAIARVQLLNLAVPAAFAVLQASSGEANSSTPAPKFLGAGSCASSSCHGGGGQNQNQFLVWSLRDFHSQRPVATLTTGRSRQIGDALQIKDPASDSHCTTCHAPLREVPESLRGPAFKVNEGVSCEICHGPTENWLRAHTRKDWTHADRSMSGMRDLKSLYVRGNTCVACHQTVETPLLKAGHPELIFELDGQCVSQPKHWRESTNWSSAQTWFVGQAIALREMSWQLSRESNPDERLIARWHALLWLMQKLDGLDAALPKLGTLSFETTPANFAAAQSACDKLALQASNRPWTRVLSRRALQTLASTADDFRKPPADAQTQARRAERLVLALDRLGISQPKPAAESLAERQLNQLFSLAQSIPDFNSASFADALAQFAQTVKD
jgi:hypothetical protein